MLIDEAGVPKLPPATLIEGETNMKFLGFLTLLFLLVSTFSVQAADTTNISITVRDLGDRVMLSGTLKNVTTPTDNAFSRAYDLSGTTPVGGVIQVWGRNIASRDVNVFLQGSSSLYDTTFASYTTRQELDDVDASGNAPVLIPAEYDTLRAQGSGSGDFDYTPYPDAAFMGRYLRIQADGQTGNPAGSETYFIITLRKVPGWQRMDGIRNRSWTITHATQ